MFLLVILWNFQNILLRAPTEDCAWIIRWNMFNCQKKKLSKHFHSFFFEETSFKVNSRYSKTLCEISLPFFIPILPFNSHKERSKGNIRKECVSGSKLRKWRGCHVCFVKFEHNFQNLTESFITNFQYCRVKQQSG